MSTTDDNKRTPRTIKVATPDLLPPPQERGAPYWLGVLPDAPFVWADCAGINFPKVNEKLIRKGMRTERLPCAGAIVYLTAAQIELLAERLPRKVVRPIPPRKREPGEIPEIEARNQRPTGAITLTIPTAEELVELRKSPQLRHRAREFVAREGDTPLARWIYCVPAGSDVEPRPINARLPESIEQTGLVIADDGEDAQPPSDSRNGAVADAGADAGADDLPHAGADDDLPLLRGTVKRR